MLRVGRRFCFLCVLVAFIGGLTYLPAQQRFSPVFEAFKLPGGPTANQVQCVVQDSVGFLWFATAAGLIRYDGQGFVTYRHDPLDSNSIASDQVEWIFLDKKGILWLGHWGKGITAFDVARGKCVRYANDPKKNSLSNDNVSMVVEDKEGAIWIATSKGLNKLDPKTGQFKHFFRHIGDDHSLSYDFVRSLYIDKSGVLWVGCGSPFDENDSIGNLGGLNRYHPDGTFTRYLHDPQSASSLSDNRVRALFEDSKGNFWVGTGGHGLQRMDRKTGVFTRLPFNPAQPSRLSSPVLQKNESRYPSFYHVAFVSEDQRGRLWIGAIEGGLNVFDPMTGRQQHFEQVAGMTDSLQTNVLWHFCQTRDGMIWLAGAGLGGKVFRVKNTDHLFPFFNAGQLGLAYATFPGVVKDSTGYIWLQTRGDFSGIMRFDPQSGHCKRFVYKPANLTRTFLDFEELKLDARKNIWASTPQGLYKMNLREVDNANACFRQDTVLTHKIKRGTVLWPPYFDRKGNTWLASWGDGLYRVDPQLECANFKHDPADPGSIGGNQVEKVFEDSEGNILVHGGSIGNDPNNPMFFDRFEPQRLGATGVFKHLLPAGEIGDPGRVIADKQGNFWFIAFPYGVRKLQKNGEYKSYTVANGALLTDAVTDMVMGQDGHIWMTAAGHIIELDPETEDFCTYSAHHGVQNLAWSWVTGAGAGPDGAIVFSGEGGFHTFFPEQVHRLWNKKNTKLYLTGFRIQGKMVEPARNSTLNRPIWETSEITLPHDQNTFSFNIACFDFYGPELSKFEFMLEHYDQNWRSDLREGEASYVNVPPGQYVFRVRGANSMGVWDKNDIALRVVMLPPWWQTWWAYLIYIVCLCGGLFALYRFQLKHRLEHVETLRLQELDAVKTKLYTNITHEFRTPLTVILGMAQQALDNPGDHFRHGLDMILRNGQNLLELVNQMLDLNKLESGHLSLHYRQGNVLNFLNYLIESFESLVEQKGVQIHFLTDLDAFNMDFDAERLQQVVSNLLSNAVKFTPAGGHIYVSVSAPQTPGTGANSLIISIKDTGIGIAAAHLPYIFDRFYQVDTDASGHAWETQGTGIGLALTKELVKLMGGKIDAKSPASGSQKGTEFMVALPVCQTTRLESPNWEALRRNTQNKAVEKPLLAAPASAEKPLILLAEDNADVVEYLASCLTADYRLAVAKNGQEALELAFDLTPDLVVTDVMMPQKNGFEVCKILKNDERSSHIPIVMLTAKADMDSRLEGLECGADAYLVKPFFKEELLVHLKKLLELRQHLQAHYLSAAGLGETPGMLKNEPPRSSLENAFVKKARAIVEAHIDDYQFDVEELCHALTMSHSQVHRKLSALTGCSAVKFIRFVRLNRAKELLPDPELNITAVSFDAGFINPSYFSKVFKQEFGVTPLEWRERHGRGA